MGYIYIAITVLLTAYGQLVLKWRLNSFTAIPEPLLEKLWFYCKIIFDPYVFSSFASAFLASLTWMAALNYFDLSKAYPFMSISFLLVMILSLVLFKESLTMQKAIGGLFIIIGVIILAKAS